MSSFRQSSAGRPLAPVAFLVAVTTFAGLVCPMPSVAQTVPPSAPPVAGWQNGFFLQSSDGLNRLQIGLLVQTDGRFGFEESDTNSILDTFAIRRLRPYLRGQVGGRFEFYLNPDFAGGTLVVQDAYIDTRFSTAFRLRVGKAKTPFGHERLHSASSLTFLERGFPTAISPNRDLGIQVLGDLAGGMVSYAGGVGNGAPDGGSVDLDTNDGKEIAGRILVRPFSLTSAVPLTGLSLALSGSRGRQTVAAALPAYRSGVVAQTFFAYSGATADGNRTRYSPYVSYYYKAFGAFGEFVHNELPVRKDPTTAVIGHDAWQAVAMFVLTGESAGESGVRPRTNFDFGDGHWGAIQIAFRYHEIVIDRRARELGLAAAGSSFKAAAWTTGLNWYLTPAIKYVFQFERVMFDNGAAEARPAENVFAFRSQLNF